ncbi:glutathione S-transferase [Penicillium canescens]|nr:glutathione S-transferase [Penicillium canescens]
MASRMDLPVYHYLDIGRLGRGEVVNLFLKDAGIEVKHALYPSDATWPQQSETLKEQGITRTGKVPALDLWEEYLTTVPILRYLARDLGGYNGETNWEKYVVDAVSDIYIDWRAQWVANLREKKPEYKDKYVPGYYNLVAEYYSDYKGPYLLGDRVTYTDFAIYQSIDNDRRTGTLPSVLPDALVNFKEAFEKRPRIAEYIKQNE